uniref:Reverse transcriptase domain-containing protein n=1 Tax=Phytophthora ramorum TaxID=164328 RepID=H3H1W0_PHYRM
MQDVEFDVDAPMEQQEVETPEGSFGVNMQASPAARRNSSVMTQQVSGVEDSEQLYTLVNGVTGEVAGDGSLEAVPAADALLELDEISIAEFGKALKAGELAEVAIIRPEDELNSSSLMDETWPLPREQCDAIDAFFRAKHEAGMSNGKWRIVHAFNKLKAATIPAQTPIPRKDVLQNDVVGCTAYSALDLVDGYYLLLMRVSDIPLTAVSTPSGMLWEWLMMPQGLSNAPATFNRLVTQLFRPHRAYAQTNFDDIFVHSRAEHRKSDVVNHIDHLRAVLECMRTNKLYANASNCIFGAKEIPFLGCFIGKRGLRADPAKVKTIVDWPVPKNQKDLRKWLGLANYLHKYSENYADMTWPLSNLLTKDEEWAWDTEHQDDFEAVKESLLYAPILALPDPDRPFSVVCDASDFATGCALLQADTEERERVIAFESRQLKAAEKNYPVHDKELLAMKYALVKFRVHLLGSKPFVIFTDHASLRTATQSPHLSQTMARWLSFFAEYNFEVKYKPGRQNGLVDALSRRPDYALSHVTTVTSSATDLIRAAYARDAMCVALLRALGSKEFEDSDCKLSARLRARLHRYSLDGGLLYYNTDPEDTPRIVVPHDEDLKYRILYEAHDTALSGHLGREKTYGSVSLSYWWPKLYKWTSTYVRTCDTCQRVKPSPHAAAPLTSLPVPSGYWKSMGMDIVFGLPKDSEGNTSLCRPFEQDGSCNGGAGHH